MLVFLPVLPSHSPRNANSANNILITSKSKNNASTILNLNIINNGNVSSHNSYFKQKKSANIFKARSFANPTASYVISRAHQNITKDRLQEFYT